MVDLQSYFPQIGSSGEKPSDGKEWGPGDNYFAVHLTYLWDQVRKRFGDVEDRLNAIDSDDDGVVDEADYAQDADASTYKGNDIDSDGDGIVNQADDANNLGGHSPSYYATSAEYDDHVTTTSGNPHGVTLEEARSQDNTLAGVLDMGVNDLVDDGTTIWDASNQYIPSAQVQGLDPHYSATDNPHSVSVGQLDTYSTSEADSNFAASGHDHDTRYYTQSAVDSNFAASDHNHDGRYYTESEADSNFSSSGHTHALGDLSNVSASGEGSGNGFDADTVDGSHASDLGGITFNKINKSTERTGLSGESGNETYETLNIGGNGHIWAVTIGGTVEGSTGSDDVTTEVTINYTDGQSETFNIHVSETDPGSTSSDSKDEGHHNFYLFGSEPIDTVELKWSWDAGSYTGTVDLSAEWVIYYLE